MIAKRIEYIDAMRGFTMFLVVLWHVMFLSFGITAQESTIATFFLTFRMPMFFFISGLLGYKAIEVFDKSQFISLVKKKSFVQLVPTFVFFSLFHISKNSSPLVFFSEGLTGYWFTLVLFELFITLYIFTLIIKSIGGGRKLLFSVLVILVIIWNVIAFFINTRYPMPKISVIFTLNNYFYYFQFFVLGCLFNACPIFKEKLIGYRSFTWFVVLFFSLFIVESKWLTYDFNRFIYYVIDSFIIRYLGLLMVFNIFALSSDYFEHNGKISRIMQFAGSRTLDIYLLHYFFLPNLEILKPYFVHEGGEFIIGEIFVLGFVSIMLMAMCLFISACLRNSPILAKYLFGILPKNYF